MQNLRFLIQLIGLCITSILVGCIHSGIALNEDMENFGSHCGPVSDQNSPFSDRLWTRLPVPPEDAQEARRKMTGTSEVDGFFDVEFWFSSGQGDLRLCAVSSYVAKNCPNIPPSCFKSDMIVSAEREVFRIGDQPVCSCHERRLAQ